MTPIIPYDLPLALRNADFGDLCRQIWLACFPNPDSALAVQEVRVSPLSGGLSDVDVLLLQFGLPNREYVRFVLRVHGRSPSADRDSTSEAYIQELKSLAELQLRASRFLSREFLPKHFALHVVGGEPRPVVVLRHAADRELSGTDSRDFGTAAASALIDSDVAAFEAFLTELHDATVELPRDWRRIPKLDLMQAQSDEALTNAIAFAALPDSILTINECQIRDNCLILGDSHSTFRDASFPDITAAGSIPSIKWVTGTDHTIPERPVLVSARFTLRMRGDQSDDTYLHCVVPGGSIAVILKTRAKDFIGQAFENGNLQKVTDLIFLPSLLTSTVQFFHNRQFPREAALTNEVIARLIAARPYHVTLTSHGDLHSGNLLLAGRGIKAIDFYNPKLRLEHADWARLATSMICRLAEILDGEMITQLSRDPNWPDFSEDTGTEPILRLRRVLHTLAGAHTTSSDYDVILAFAVEASRYLRYMLEGLVAPSSLLFAWATFWCNRVNSHPQTLADPVSHGANSRTKQRTIYDLWHRTIYPTNAAIRTERADRVLQAVVTTRKANIARPLSELQEAYLTKLDDDSLTDSPNTLVLGPTSTGKSTIAQTALIAHLLSPPNDSKPCAVYIAPTKAQTHEFYLEIKELLKLAGLTKDRGTEVIIATGDDVEYDHCLSQGRFKIACIVNEKANAVLSRSPYLLGRVGLLVADELHMIQENERGPILETLLMKLRSQQVASLSDTTRRSSDDISAISPRLIGISTEQESTNLKGFFSTRDKHGATIAPVVVHSAARPVPVLHRLVFRDNSATEAGLFQLAIEPLVEIAGDRKRYLDQKQIQELSNRLSRWVNIDTAPPARHEDLRGVRHAMTLDLCRRLLIESPYGRTILVFTSSKRECIDIAKKLTSWRKEHAGFVLPKETQQEEVRRKFNDAADGVEGAEEATDLRHFASAEVYIHNAEVDPQIRRVIQELFSMSGTSSPSRLLVATTTLAYGVNLAVTDVILEHTVFPTATRIAPSGTTILSDFISEEQIEPVEFHNMAGRAGRLGFAQDLGAASFFVVSPRGVDPLNDIIIPYYSAGRSRLGSTFFSHADRASLSQMDDDSRIPWLSQSIPSLGVVPKTSSHLSLGSKHFSFPFARCVLDIVRHLCYSNVRDTRSGSNPLKPVTASDVFIFIARYSLLRLDSEQGRRHAEASNHLRKAIDAILIDSVKLGLLKAEPKLEVVEPDVSAATAAEAGYTIQSIGEAMLETGTEFSIVVPLIELMALIKRAWSEPFERAAYEVPTLPPEIFILAMIFQEDVCRRYRMAVPEWRTHRNDSKWGDLQKRANESFVLTEFIKSLKRILPANAPVPAEPIAESLRHHLNQWLSSGLFRPIPLPYERAPADGGLRFFISMIHWIGGDHVDQCRDALTVEFSSSGEERRGPRVVGFLDYVSRLAYRARFLAALCVEEAKATDTEVSLSLERELIRISQRLGSGCVSDAVSLFWPRSSNLNRRQAMGLLNDGLNAAGIARDGIPEDVAKRWKLSNEKASLLAGDVANLAASELERLWNELKPRDASEDELRTMLAEVEKWIAVTSENIKNSGRSYRARRLVDPMFEGFVGASRLSARERFGGDCDRSLSEDDRDDERKTLVLEPVGELSENMVPGGKLSGTLLRLSMPASKTPGQVIAMVATATQSGDQLGNVCKAVVSKFEKGASGDRLTAICCVLLPWANAREVNGTVPQILTSFHEAVSPFFLTPMGFCVVVSFLLRGFLSPLKLFQIAADANRELVSVERLVDEFKLLDHKDIPPVIRRELLSVFEVL